MFRLFFSAIISKKELTNQKLCGITELSKETLISFLSVVQHKKSLLSKNNMMTLRGVCLITLPALSIARALSFAK